MASIVLFNGNSANGVIRDRVARDAQLIEARGHDVMVIDLAKHQTLKVPRKIDLFVGYQGWGHDIRLGDGSLLVERFGCPYAVMLGDHPVQHASRIREFPDNTVVFVSSRNQQSFLRQALQFKGDVRLFTSTVSPDMVQQGVERDISVLMVGQVVSPDTFLAAHDMPKPVRGIIREFLVRAEKNPGVDPVADYMSAGYQRVLEYVDTPAMAINAGRLLDLTARHQFRWSYAQALRKLPVTFVGNDWVAMEREADDAFKALPSVAHSELAGLYARAQIGLNLFAPYFDFHERILDTMVQGAAAATMQTEWLSELFAFGADILALPDNPDKLKDWLEGLLAEPDQLAAIGEAGQKRALADFNDETRIDLLLDLLEDSPQQVAQARG